MEKRTQHVVTVEIVAGKITRSWLANGSPDAEKCVDSALNYLLDQGWTIISQSEISQDSMSTGIQTFVLQIPDAEWQRD